MERGFDPELKKYFRKILYSFSYGFLWLAVNITAGIFFKMAFINERPLPVNLLFYAFLILSLFFLIRYYVRVWKK